MGSPPLRLSKRRLGQERSGALAPKLALGYRQRVKAVEGTPALGPSAADGPIEQGTRLNWVRLPVILSG
jgi:hypothetical protein